jgi:mediator of RNA polymerase II transcription subunit 12
LQKILEYYQGSGGGSAVAAAQSGFLTAAPATVIDLDGATRQWNYGVQLAQHMYSEGLLDRHEFLSWIVELLEKVKITDDTVLKLVLALVLKVGQFSGFFALV